MTRRHTIALCGAFLFAAGCTINVGRKVSDLAVANSPAGTVVGLQFGTSAAGIMGELLAARDSGLVVLSDGRIVFARYESISSTSVADSPPLIASRRRPSAQSLADLRLLSRYPQDIPDDLMARLLASTGQASIAVVDR